MSFIICYIIPQAIKFMTQRMVKISRWKLAINNHQKLANESWLVTTTRKLSMKVGWQQSLKNGQRKLVDHGCQKAANIGWLMAMFENDD